MNRKTDAAGAIPLSEGLIEYVRSITKVYVADDDLERAVALKKVLERCVAICESRMRSIKGRRAAKKPTS